MTYSREEVEAARERLVSVEELTEELRWHVHFDDDDEQVPCNICGSDDVPCIVERLALDWRNAHARTEALEAANESLEDAIACALTDLRALRKKLPDESPNLEAAIYNLIHALEPVDD